MSANKFEDSRVVEGTLRSDAQHAGTGFKEPKLNQSSAVSRNGRILAASTLKGDPVRNKAGKELGTIDEIALDPESGRIAYAVVAFGGFPTLGEKLFAVLERSRNTGAEHFPDRQESSSRF